MAFMPLQAARQPGLRSCRLIACAACIPATANPPR